MRKVIIIIILLAAVGFGIWWYVAVRGTGKSIPQAVSEISFPLVGSIASRTGGDSTGYGTDQANTDADSTNTNTPAPKQKLEQLVPTAVAGFTVFNVQKSVAGATETAPTTGGFSSNNYIRYVDRAGGYVYEIANGGVATQISNVYIPNIYEAFFGTQGSKAYLRFLRDDQKTIATFAVPIPEANLDGSRTQLPGFFLPDNISTFAVSPDTNLLAQLAPNGSGGTVLTVSDSSNKSRRDILNTPFRDWLISWTSQRSVSVQTKAAGTVPGYFYTILQSDVRLKKILSGVRGLTASISPNSNYVLYSESTVDGFFTKMYTVSTGTITTLAIQALPEKCIWTTNEDIVCATTQNPAAAVYPDSWYAGLTKFSDRIVRINPSLGVLTVLYDEGTSFDATNLQLDEANNQLYFINKNDASLWRLNL